MCARVHVCVCVCVAAYVGHLRAILALQRRRRRRRRVHDRSTCAEVLQRESISREEAEMMMMRMMMMMMPLHLYSHRANKLPNGLNITRLNRSLQTPVLFPSVHAPPPPPPTVPPPVSYLTLQSLSSHLILASSLRRISPLLGHLPRYYIIEQKSLLVLW